LGRRRPWRRKARRKDGGALVGTQQRQMLDERRRRPGQRWTTTQAAARPDGGTHGRERQRGKWRRALGGDRGCSNGGGRRSCEGLGGGGGPTRWPLIRRRSGGVWCYVGSLSRQRHDRGRDDDAGSTRRGAVSVMAKTGAGPGWRRENMLARVPVWG
jgi:hypothetical protein